MSFNTPQPPRTGLRVAQAVGITFSAYLFGQMAGLSYITIPSLMEAPAAVAARQWEKAFLTGRKVGVPMALVSALATGYTAFCLPRHSRAFRLNLAATLILPSIIPFTLLVMQPTNAALQEKRAELATLSDQGVGGKEGEVGTEAAHTVHALLDKWATLNVVRALLVGAGCGCAVVGLLG